PHRGPVPAPTGKVGQNRRRGRVLGGMGTLVGRGPGEPAVVPGAELLPLATRQPVVAGGPDGRARYLRPAGRGGRRQPPLPGTGDIRQGRARRRGPRADPQAPAAGAGSGPPAGRATDVAPWAIAQGRHGAPRRRGGECTTN